MKITSDFAGGNCRLISVENSNDKTVVNLEQELRDTPNWWFYWCFCVEDAPEGEVIFVFNNGDVVCPHGPTTSTDGIHWQWCEDAFVSHTRFKYTFSKNDNKRYFAFSIPYLVADFERFYDSIRNDTAVVRSVLTQSEKGRELPLLTIGQGQKDILLTARHHCCESTASYALEGAVNSILGEHRDILNEYRFHILPFVDIDGVEQGDQGKDRAPHDHNRDYIDKPIYNYTRAIYKYVESMNLTCFLDFHSPWSWGGRDDEPHIHLAPAVMPTPTMQEDFVKALTTVTQLETGNIIRYNGTTIPYGTHPNKIGNKNSKNYFKLQCKANLAVSIETPYSGNLNNGYTVEQLHTWGGHIIKALYNLLKNKKEL